MIPLIFFCGASLLLGLALGRVLARSGIRADLIVEAQPGVFLGSIVCLGSVLSGLAFLDYSNRLSVLPYLFPSGALLYLGAHFTDGLFVLSSFAIGFLVALEAAGWRSPQRRGQLLVALLSISCALGLLFHFARPVAPLVGELKLDRGVVRQTTPYTCAPASIASLTRFLGTHPDLTEREAAELSHTNRFGTSTLDQLRALDRLGIDAKYEFGLTLPELARRQQLAILSVRELYEGRRISHAVALLRIDSQGNRLTIANPLVGLELKTPEDMVDYWFGEAILIQRASEIDTLQDTALPAGDTSRGGFLNE